MCNTTKNRANKGQDARATSNNQLRRPWPHMVWVQAVMMWKPALNAFTFPLRRAVRQNRSLLKTAPPHTPLIGQAV